MIRISCTDLDSYRWYRGSEDAALEDLLRRLRREEEPTPAMMAGRAFHKLLETTTDGELIYTEVDGFSFRFDLDAEIELAPIRELKGEMVVQTSVGPVTLVGVIDRMHGLTVRDYKLTSRFDAERYADSYQWRSYLEMFGAKKFVYDVFVGKERDPGEYVIYDYQTIAFYAYDGMNRDIEMEVDGLARIVDKHLPEHCRMEAA